MPAARRSGSGKAGAQAPALARLPNGLNLAGLGLGLMAILASADREAAPALQFLAAAGLADLLAGGLARSRGWSSELGGELDSLASVLIWGLGASQVAYQAGLGGLGAPGVAVTGFFVLASAWRLCKGDIQSRETSYRGLPLPMAGLILVALAALGAPAWGLALAVLLLALALLGPWSYSHWRPGGIMIWLLLAGLGLAALGFSRAWGLAGTLAGAYALAAPWALPALRRRQPSRSRAGKP